MDWTDCKKTKVTKQLHIDELLIKSLMKQSDDKNYSILNKHLKDKNE